jgi:putative glutamine amidotransferase
MKNILSLILLLILQHPISSQDYFNLPENQHAGHLILVHPTRSNLERYTYLIEQGILNPGDLKIVGLFFEAENYIYEGVIAGYPGIAFHQVPGKLSPEELYRENGLTESFRKVFDCSSGIIFNGGPDIPPVAYGEEMSTRTSATDPFRSFHELSFLFHLLGGSQNESFGPLLNLKPGYSILGICLGMQSMNVATGGSLIQDIPSEIYNQETVEAITASDRAMQHRNYNYDLHLDPAVTSYILHPVKIPGKGRMGQVAANAGNTTPLVFSSHHQAIKDIGKGWHVTATSPDGQIIEAIEHTVYPHVFGVQFHPEVDVLYRNEKLYKREPGEQPFPAREKLEETNSLEFHLQLWRCFSESIQKQAQSVLDY